MKRLFVLPVTLFAALSLVAVAPAAGQDRKDPAPATQDQAVPAAQAPAAAAQDQAAPAAADAKDQAAPAAADAQDQAAPAAAQDQAASAKDKKSASAKDKKAQQDAKKKPAKNEKDDPEAIGARDVGNGVNFYSLEKEIALGKQLAQEVERQAKIIDDPIIAEYVNRVGQNLVRNSDAKVPFTIKVLDSEEVNAFALPGGFFFVNSGLILKADNEAELAGVMAHEIAHVAAPARHQAGHPRGDCADRHDCRSIVMGRLDGLRHPARPPAWPSPGLPAILARPFETRSRLPGPAVSLQVGLRSHRVRGLLREDPDLEKKKPGTMAKVFSTHPMTDDRIKATPSRKSRRSWWPSPSTW